jgi:hypothetical protein
LFIGTLKFLLLMDMIVPQGKKLLSCSLRQIKLLLPKDMIFPQGKTNFFEEQ